MGLLYPNLDVDPHFYTTAVNHWIFRMLASMLLNPEIALGGYSSEKMRYLCQCTDTVLEVHSYIYEVGINLIIVRYNFQSRYTDLVILSLPCYGPRSLPLDAGTFSALS